ncbi:MAG: hypothetical protein IKN05_05445 [Clostridia bacterium]|nr:hypothetical protein [Clostridia bacterium]
MIAKLRRRLTLLVIGVMALVTLGIVLSIRLITLRNIDATAAQALQVLSENRGQRPPAEDGETPPEKPDGTPGETPPEKPDGTPPPLPEGEGRQKPGLEMSGGTLASQANAYTIRLNTEGEVTGWDSDRADLYTDRQIAAVAEAALASGASTGRVDTQYYAFAEGESPDGRLLVVLDARLEFQSADRMLRATALVASLAGVLLCAGAYLLIRKMLRPVQAAFERQKQFVWDASHEFKTPLAVISANAEVLSREIGPNEYLGYIQSEVRRADSLVQSLLTLARMDKGTVAAALTRFNLSDALLGVALPFESTVFEAGRTLETDIPEGIYLKGDEAMLQQLTVILLSNALKYSDPDGLIRLSLAAKGRGAVITVYNTGQGIAPENLEKIFDRFYREDASHNSQVAGNGLGLAIARTIAEAHRGHIRAESEPGRSATFVVTLPG